MPEPAPLATDGQVPPASAAALEEDGLVEMDVLVEEVSIDGMCGVY